MEVVEDVAESGLESASIGQAASRLFVDEDPDLVVDAPWLVDLGQQTRRARPKSCLRRPPRAWRQRSKPWVLMALTHVKCDTVAQSACIVKRKGSTMLALSTASGCYVLIF